MRMSLALAALLAAAALTIAAMPAQAIAPASVDAPSGSADLQVYFLCLSLGLGFQTCAQIFGLVYAICRLTGGFPLPCLKLA